MCVPVNLTGLTEPWVSKRIFTGVWTTYQWFTTDIDFLPSPSHYFLFDFLLYLFIYHKGTCASWHTCKGQRTTCGAQFSHATLLIPGTELVFIVCKPSDRLRTLSLLLECWQSNHPWGLWRYSQLQWAPEYWKQDLAALLPTNLALMFFLSFREVI